LVLAALKTATDHLVEGGTFCTKVYRSVDYNAVVWVLQQLFEDIQTIKPNSSRSQSSEIFLVCLRYTAPKFIDPKLLDPNHVFKEVNDPGLSKVDVFHKKYEQSNKRHRTGYDESLGILLTNSASVSEFVSSKEPIQMLTNINKLIFTDQCNAFKDNAYTSDEILNCFKDLRVLGKVDFKKILKWRDRVREALLNSAKETGGSLNNESEQHDKVVDDRDEDEIIIEEISKMREKIFQNERREKKKDRKVAAKERDRRSLGMHDANGLDIFAAEDVELFGLDKKTSLKELDDLCSINLNDDDNDDMFDENGSISSSDSKVKRKPQVIFVDDDDALLEDELEQDYKRFLVGRRSLEKKASEELNDNLVDRDRSSNDLKGTVSMKKMKNDLKAENLISRKNEDDAKFLDGNLEEDERLDLNKSKKVISKNNANVTQLMESYVKMLNDGPTSKRTKTDGLDADSNSSEDEEVENVFETKNSDPKAVTEHVLTGKEKTDLWFSNPIFKSSAALRSKVVYEKRENNSYESNMLLEMPRTDREIRKEKRKKDSERRERRENRIATRNNNELNDFTEEHNVDAVSKKRKAESNDIDDIATSDIVRTDPNNATKIKANFDTSFEIVPQEKIDSNLHIDARRYDSENEQYDNHDKATTIALATMMLRNSRKKALVDASYNRFSWNDPKGLPVWFQDDEMRHNKPQLPIPQALMEQVDLCVHRYCSKIFSFKLML
jgi:AdoMet-dependent rRNA methyltransferase SPB1